MTKRDIGAEVSESKLRILNAAARVAQTVGTSKLTLARVAVEAGLSKGGLLYHYPSKNALLEGMVAHALSGVEVRRDAAERADAQVSDFILHDTTEDAQERAIAQSLLAAAAENPDLLAPARASSKQWLNAASKHSDIATVVFLASEGLRFLDLLNLMPSNATRKASIDALNTVASRATRESKS